MSRNEIKDAKTDLKQAARGINLGSTPAEVVELVGRAQGKQAVMQVRCKILEGRSAGKIVRRNVLGSVQEGDILILTQTEIEAAPLKGGRR